MLLKINSGQYLLSIFLHFGELPYNDDVTVSEV